LRKRNIAYSRPNRASATTVLGTSVQKAAISRS
jgi:hypothetical protein